MAKPWAVVTSFGKYIAFCDTRKIADDYAYQMNTGLFEDCPFYDICCLETVEEEQNKEYEFYLVPQQYRSVRIVRNNDNKTEYTDILNHEYSMEGAA